MNIKESKLWDSLHLKSVEENDYLNRRVVLKQLGLTTGGLILGSIPIMGKNVHQDLTFSFDGMQEYYPAKRNGKYVLDRPLTEEFDATHYNNFYEFISREDPNIYNVYKFVDRFDTSDWRFEVSGLARRTGTYFLGGDHQDFWAGGTDLPVFAV